MTKKAKPVKNPAEEPKISIINVDCNNHATIELTLTLRKKEDGTITFEHKLVDELSRSGDCEYPLELRSETQVWKSTGLVRCMIAAMTREGAWPMLSFDVDPKKFDAVYGLIHSPCLRLIRIELGGTQQELNDILARRAAAEKKKEGDTDAPFQKSLPTPWEFDTRRRLSNAGVRIQQLVDEINQAAKNREYGRPNMPFDKPLPEDHIDKIDVFLERVEQLILVPDENSGPTMSVRRPTLWCHAAMEMGRQIENIKWSTIRGTGDIRGGWFNTGKPGVSMERLSGLEKIMTEWGVAWTDQAILNDQHWRAPKYSFICAAINHSLGRTAIKDAK